MRWGGEVTPLPYLILDTWDTKELTSYMSSRVFWTSQVIVWNMKSCQSVRRSLNPVVQEYAVQWKQVFSHVPFKTLVRFSICFISSILQNQSVKEGRVDDFNNEGIQEHAVLINCHTIYRYFLYAFNRKIPTYRAWIDRWTPVQWNRPVAKRSEMLNKIKRCVLCHSCYLCIPNGSQALKITCRLHVQCRKAGIK